MSSVKLLVCYHKPSFLLKDEVLTPIHVGRALAKKRMDQKSQNYQWLMKHLIGDDTGENISDKNGSYNEMTSLYWAWKNYDKLGNPDYIGLMHYRRHLIMRAGEIDVVNFEELDEENYLKEINYSPKKVYQMVDGCDFVAHIGKVKNVYKHYVENHRQEDLDLAFDILYEFYPEYKEVAKEYFDGDLSNFCNMFIFKKEIFFDYCEWIFGILQEFEKRVDTSEKRFFISERLTGVYIAKLMKDKTLKHKVVPISFVAEKVTIPIAMPYSEESEFQLATTITSILTNKNDTNIYQIYLLHSGEIVEKVKEKFAYFERTYTNCKIEFIDAKVNQEYYPLVLAELIPSINKCIYMTEYTTVLKDLTEFYRTCSTDDYYIVGAPLKKYDIYEKERQVNTAFLVMNLMRLRQHKVYENAKEFIEKEEDGILLFNRLCAGQLGYVPWYFITVVSQSVNTEKLFDKNRARGHLQGDASWKPIMFYDTVEPWSDPQGVYSIFWWNMAVKVPILFKFDLGCSDYILKTNFSKQQKEINEIGTLIQMPKTDFIENEKKENEKKEIEDWHDYSMFGKLKFYYDNNGLKRTVSYCFDKYVRRVK